MKHSEKPVWKPELNEKKLVETIGRIRDRIGTRFPDSGLCDVAGKIETLTREAVKKAEAIRRPDWRLRVLVGLVFLLAIVAIIAQAPTREDQVSFWKATFQFLDVTKVGTAVLMATPIFLITLETRLKRHRALKAIHELRALAHIIDMHQLTKSPDGIRPVDVAGKTLDAGGMAVYLNYCTELLALISKLGQLYVQDFSDATVLAAVDRFEELTNGLSNKMWQKIMILDRVRFDGVQGK